MSDAPDAVDAADAPDAPGTAGEEGDRVGLEHGAGGAATRELVSGTLAAGFSDPEEALVGLEGMDDGAVLPVGDENLVVTTDSHVVQPPFFPGGDIGRLAVSGTVNDLAVMGGTDVRALTSAVVVEANYPTAKLERVADSMAETCEEADAAVVTGDTKVMGHGEVDGVVVNTAGVGVADHVTPDDAVEANDVVIVTDAIGQHGISLLAEREGI